MEREFAGSVGQRQKRAVGRESDHYFVRDALDNAQRRGCCAGVREA